MGCGDLGVKLGASPLRRRWPGIALARHWRGRPLTSHEVIVETIAATTTSTGLTVHAELDQAEYPTGIKIPDKQIKALETEGILTRHDFHGEWNYTINPAPRHARDTQD